MIKTLLVTMFVYLAGHSIKSLNLLKETAGITQKQWMDGDHQSSASLMGPATEFPIAVYAIGTLPVKKLSCSITFVRLQKRNQQINFWGMWSPLLCSEYLKWKPPQIF